MQIAFPPDDAALFQRQLEALTRKKRPRGTFQVNDATSLGGRLILELAEAGDPPCVPQPFGAAPDTRSRETRDAVRRAVWHQRGRGGTRRGIAAGAPDRVSDIRLLCVHGIGHGDVDATLQPRWTACLSAQLKAHNPSLNPQFSFLAYDDLFDQAPHNVLTYAEAFLRLGWSSVSSLFSDWFSRRGQLADGSEAVRWTAGMVAQWAENEDLREETRRRLKNAMDNFKPDVVVAHSLGSLVGYDTFSRIEDQRGRSWNGPGLIRDRFFVTLGSQIGSRFTRLTLGGRIKALQARHWFHLFNPHDRAFTAELTVAAPNFDQLLTPFNIDGVLDHEATAYLQHPIAAEGCWRSIALARPLPVDASRALTKIETQAGKLALDRKTQQQKHSAGAALRLSVLRPAPRLKPSRRALLVGINDYPNPADRLQGCVNDVFLMSSLLQEIGFAAEDIRIVLNERATAAGLRERLEWLLDGTQDGMERVFYYSGHGAQIPGYGIGEKVDRKDECLVTYDFDWSLDHALTDDQFYDLYSQLPYTAKFYAVFDCCHSGGMIRDGGPKVRGLTPPDDIRHRTLRWNAAEQMWVQRDLGAVSRERARLLENRHKHAALFGEDGATSRLGCAAALRPEDKVFDRARNAFGHFGPYLPVILQASQEKEYSFEYRHGTQSYGAFTYSLGQIVREQLNKAKSAAPPTWHQLVARVSAKLARLRYDQHPALVCPRPTRRAPVPWFRAIK